jgi:uncharacterized protein (DUF1697 family)
MEPLRRVVTAPSDGSTTGQVGSVFWIHGRQEGIAGKVVAMTVWVGLLRGVNVGGANKLPMKDLRASIEWLGYRNVESYIQSGNLIFESDAQEERVVSDLRRLIEDRHGLTVPVVARTFSEMEAALIGHPSANGDVDPKLLHVAFLDRAPDDPGSVAADAWAPDLWSVSGRELYLTYPNGSARSKMTIDRFEKPWGVTATARNLNTVAKIVDLAARR